MTCHLQTVTNKVVFEKKRILIKLRFVTTAAPGHWRSSLPSVIKRTDFQVQVKVRLRLTRDSLIIRNNLLISFKLFPLAKFSHELIMMLDLCNIECRRSSWSPLFLRNTAYKFFGNILQVSFLSWLKVLSTHVNLTADMNSRIYCYQWINRRQNERQAKHEPSKQNFDRLNKGMERHGVFWCDKWAHLPATAQ